MCGKPEVPTGSKPKGYPNHESQGGTTITTKVSPTIVDFAEEQLRLVEQERKRREQEIRTLSRLELLLRREVVGVSQPRAAKTRNGRRKGLGERAVTEIAKLLGEKGPMRPREIRTELKAKGFRMTADQVYRVLGSDRFHRPSHGKYTVKAAS